MKKRRTVVTSRPGDAPAGHRTARRREPRDKEDDDDEALGVSSPAEA